MEDRGLVVGPAVAVLAFLVVVAKGPRISQFSVLWGTTWFEAVAVFVARLLSGAGRRSCSCRVSAEARTSTSGMSQVQHCRQAVAPNIVVDWRRRLQKWWRREAKVTLLRPRVSRLLTALVVRSWDARVAAPAVGRPP